MNHAKAAAGRTIMEVMVSLAIAAVILGAVLLTVSGTGVSGRKQDAHAQLVEEGQVALNVLASQLRMAGYTAPRVNNSPGAPSSNYVGPPLRACDNGFDDVGAADLASLACVGAPGPAAFSVVYEADVSSTLPSAGTNSPTDCLGQDLTANATSLLPGGGTYVLAENRFFIQNNPQTGNPSLYCAGNGGASPFDGAAPLIDNVEDMQLTFGLATTSTDELGNLNYEGSVVRYMTASEIDSEFSADVARWRRVSSVRLCIIVRTEDRAADTPADYVDCAGNVVTPADLRIRRALTATIGLRNRIAIAASS